jgi:hypothetical protein
MSDPADGGADPLLAPGAPEELEPPDAAGLGTFAVLCLFGTSFTAIAWTLVAKVPVWPWYVAVATSAVTAAAPAGRRSLGPRGTAFAMLACTASILTASAASNWWLAAAGLHFEAFSAFKATALTIALVAPRPRWVGHAVLAACGLVPIALYLTYPPAIRAAFPVQEPWATLLCAAIALIVLRSRLEAHRLERELARVVAERDANEESERLFTGLRDLTNTPLQTIEIVAALLRGQHIPTAEAAVTLEHALARLRELSKTLRDAQDAANAAKRRAGRLAAAALPPYGPGS